MYVGYDDDVINILYKDQMVDKVSEDRGSEHYGSWFYHRPDVSYLPTCFLPLVGNP